MTPVRKLEIKDKDELIDFLKGSLGDKLAIDYKLASKSKGNNAVSRTNRKH